MKILAGFNFWHIKYLLGSQIWALKRYGPSNISCLGSKWWKCGLYLPDKGVFNNYSQMLLYSKKGKLKLSPEALHNQIIRDRWCKLKILCKKGSTVVFSYKGQHIWPFGWKTCFHCCCMYKRKKITQCRSLLWHLLVLVLLYLFQWHSVGFWRPGQQVKLAPLVLIFPRKLFKKKSSVLFHTFTKLIIGLYTFHEQIWSSLWSISDQYLQKGWSNFFFYSRSISAPP